MEFTYKMIETLLPKANYCEENKDSFKMMELYANEGTQPRKGWISVYEEHSLWVNKLLIDWIYIMLFIYCWLVDYHKYISNNNHTKKKKKKNNLNNKNDNNQINKNDNNKINKNDNNKINKNNKSDNTLNNKNNKKE